MMDDWTFIFFNQNFWNCLLSFLVGVLSVGLFWVYHLLPDRLDDVSLIDPWNDVIKPSWKDWTRIGELPREFFAKKRKHWPWETIRQRFTQDSPLEKVVAFTTEDKEEEHSIASDEQLELEINSTDDGDGNSSKDAKQTCIGSIFGLDVGGSLAKLVYFEKKSADYDLVSIREKHYTQAASAQAVLLARQERSESPDLTIARRRSAPIQTLSLDTRNLEDLRQESVPDDLDKFMDSVNFEVPETPKHPQNKEQQQEKVDENESESNSTVTKSRSMFNLSEKRKKAEALDRFYNFARRLDSYEDSVRDHKLSFYSKELGGDFHFIRFETRRMKNAMDLIRVNNLHLNICEMGATGGGAHKYAEDWERSLGIRMDKQEELDSLVAGMQFVLSTVVGECYTFRPKTTLPNTNSLDDDDMHPIGAPIDESPSTSEAEDSDSFEKPTDKGDWSRKVQRDTISYSSAYPYLLVTIGTGVSILRVDGPRKHQRVSGSTIGGGTYWGLIRLLTDVEDFEGAMQLAEKGDPAKVDMMVGDIYGEDSKALEKLGLPSNIVASSFGKLVAKEDPASGLKQEDLARALLLMVTNNIGQVAYLNAKLHNTPRIYFVGNFLRQNMISQRRLSYAIDYWSKGEMEALFLEHEGYFGALGAFLISQNISPTEKGIFEWEDNLAKSPPEVSRSRSVSGISPLPLIPLPQSIERSDTR